MDDGRKRQRKLGRKFGILVTLIQQRRRTQIVGQEGHGIAKHRREEIDIEPRKIVRGGRHPRIDGAQAGGEELDRRRKASA